jgi:hypothetical protein
MSRPLLALLATLALGGEATGVMAWVGASEMIVRPADFDSSSLGQLYRFRVDDAGGTLLSITLDVRYTHPGLREAHRAIFSVYEPNRDVFVQCDLDAAVDSAGTRTYHARVARSLASAAKLSFVYGKAPGAMHTFQIADFLKRK